MINLFRGDLMKQNKTTLALFSMNTLISVSYLWASIFSTDTISNIILIIAIASFLFAIIKIEKSEKRNKNFLSRAMIMLPMFLLIANFRTSQSVASNSILIMIILSGIAYNFFWKNREECSK